MGETVAVVVAAVVFLNEVNVKRFESERRQLVVVVVVVALGTLVLCRPCGPVLV